MNVVAHYDRLIAMDNDPVLDPPELKAYMDKWDGAPFIECLHLNGAQDVLEIGVSAGRLAVRIAPQCGSFTGIDISPKTIGRAARHLAECPNVSLVCGDFMEHAFDRAFDAVYSSLASMHFEDKLAFIHRACALLRPGGRFVLSIDKNQSPFIDMGDYRLTIYPDDPVQTESLLLCANMRIESRIGTEFAHIFSAVRV